MTIQVACIKTAPASTYTSARAVLTLEEKGG